MNTKSNGNIPAWKQWNPGLDIDENTLGEIAATLPENERQQTHPLVQLFENPKSPIAFKGAISLQRHNLVHILLGRGFLPQDEAFVIGYTMGTSKTISSVETWLFEKITHYFYPAPYHFGEPHLKIFKLAVEAGKSSAATEIYNISLEDMQDRTIGELRTETGIDAEALRGVFTQEIKLLPESEESQRLKW